MWVWVNTYRYIFSGLFTSINPSYFGVHQGYRVLTHTHGQNLQEFIRKMLEKNEKLRMSSSEAPNGFLVDQVSEGLIILIIHGI